MTRLDKAKETLKQQAFSRFIGANISKFEAGEAELTLEIRDEHMQQHGFVHGGVLAYLADNALTFCGGSVLNGVLTSEMKINYARPAVGQTLVARAAVVSSGRTQAICRCDIFVVKDGVEKLCAAAQGTIVQTPAAR